MITDQHIAISNAAGAPQRTFRRLYPAGPRLSNFALNGGAGMGDRLGKL